MKKTAFIISLFILFSCSQKTQEVRIFSATFGNALHGGITLSFDKINSFLILKRVGSKKPLLPPPPPPSENGYTLKQRDSINRVEKQYYLDYAQPKTAVYKLTTEEVEKLVKLIDSIPQEDRKDFIPEYPMYDGFSYNFQIIYSNGYVDDIEVEHLNIPSHEKVIYQMLFYAKKNELDENNILVLKNFENWSHPKY
ncbi:hypothetical protein [Chryseobacterium fistulae]|uniref:Lipoprotein n=1 Tax=Chryseobacterium fistulae TaxID=2675058 RepID=A0A6N4XNW8_9FLAO|nr:hypothetical protein [Chryseobacterium fistulae]CAA7388021.1 hypothetical protein CHRY9393_01873 [Chryseobacterium fistulae]